MATLTTIKLENRGISANIIDCGIIECSANGSFEKGHGGCLSWIRRNTVGNGRQGWLAEHGVRRGDEGWEQESCAERPCTASPASMTGTGMSVRAGFLIPYHS